MENHSGSFVFTWILVANETTLLGSDVLFYVVNAFILMLLLTLSALVSGSEVGLFSLNEEEVELCKESENNSEKIIVRLLEHKKLLLATILIFNNLLNVGIVTLSTYITWQIFGTKDITGITLLILTIVVTLLLLFFGELLPKVYANRQNLAFARLSAPLLKYAMRFFNPLAYMLVSMTNIVEKRVQKKGYTLSRDELSEAIQITTENGEATEKDKEILKGIVNFNNISVKQIMTSRHNIMAIDVATPFEELLQKIRESGYSRIPVYQETIDRIEGILYVKDLLEYVEERKNFRWKTLLRNSYFVPPNKKIDKLLRDFQEKHVHMAVVADEYGGTAGIVTMEDIIEEIVGDINDEFDELEEGNLYTQLENNSYLFQSKISLNDFCKVLDIDNGFFDKVKGESESLGGLMLEIFSRLPKVGEVTKHEQFVFTIYQVDSKKIKIIKVEFHEVTEV